MEPSPDLLSLPNEILGQICVHAQDSDETKSRGKEWLRAARLTCKQLCVVATVEFGKQFLASVPVMVARGSLETLFDICKHPLIGPQVTEIQLYGCRSSRYALHMLQEELEECLGSNNLHQARQIRHQLNLLLDFREQEIEFETFQGIFQHLESALKTICGHGSSVTLSVFTDVSVKPLDHIRASKQISQDSQDTLHDNFGVDCVRSTLQTLLVAAARSGCPVERLKIGSDTWYEGAEDISGVETTFKESLLSKVKVLHVRMNRCNFVKHFQETLNIILQPTRNLAELYLRFEQINQTFLHGGDVDICARLIHSVQSRCLHKIELQEMVCRPSDILALLDNNSDTVKDLRLSEVILLGSWSVVMTWIRDHCSLEFMSARKLLEFEEDETDETGHFWNGDEVTWVDDGFGRWDESGDLSHLDSYLEQKRKEQAEIREED
jgi:hypothetical protein